MSNLDLRRKSPPSASFAGDPWGDALTLRASVTPGFAVCCSVLQCVAMCVAACCSVLQRVAVCDLSLTTLGMMC